MGCTNLPLKVLNRSKGRTNIPKKALNRGYTNVLRIGLKRKKGQSVSYTNALLRNCRGFREL